jgi:outer membrane protein TolC
VIGTMTTKSFVRAGLALLLVSAPFAAAAQDAPAATTAPNTLPLSLEEAVQKALENNPDILVEKLGPVAGAASEREARGAYDPLLTSTLLRTSSTTPGTNAFSGGDEVDTDTFDYSFGASKLFRTGGALSLDFVNSRETSTSTNALFSPLFGSNLQARFSQPLLRNLSIDSARQHLRIANRNREISDVQFEQTVANTIATVKNRYYDLLYAIDNLAAQKRSLDLANQFLGENRIRVRVGTLAPLDVVAAESEVASREETAIVAEAAMRDAQDALRRAVLPSSGPELWTLDIVPTDRPSAEAVTVDVAAAITRALENRTDVKVARRSLENAETSASFAHNQTLPALDLVATYGTIGAGGTQIRRGFGQPLLDEPIPGGYGDAFSDVFGREFPTWSVGVNFSYPLFNRSASGRSARAAVARDQSALSLKRLELDVTIEVRQAGRAVETNAKRVASTQAARVLQEKRLDAENKRFGAGMSTNFLVTQAQRDLAFAEVAELRALADYRKSLVAFDLVQKAGLSSATRADVITVSAGGTGSSSATRSTTTSGTTSTSSSGSFTPGGGRF